MENNSSLKILQVQGSLSGGSLKALLETKEGFKIETVLMVYRDWITACLSVMSGCSLKCKLCATGNMGFNKNLTKEEIVDQVVFWNDLLKLPQPDSRGITPIHSVRAEIPPKRNNISASPDRTFRKFREGGLINFKTRVARLVFMGMGEPFLNWENTWEAIKIIKNPGRFNIGERQMAISTVGIVPMMYKFADMKTKIDLAISLHSPFQEKREEIIPVAKQYPITEIMKAAGYYVKKNQKKVFFEYALLEKFNDRFEDIFEIKKLFGSPLFHLNVIVYNQTDSKFKGSGMGRRDTFIRALKKNNIPYSVRRSLGREINAACGQLAGKN